MSKVGRDPFTLAEILSEITSRKSAYAETTVRTHVTSKLYKHASTHPEKSLVVGAW